MAKKLNKKSLSSQSLFWRCVPSASVRWGIRYLSGRNPETNLEKARQALAAEDYQPPSGISAGPSPTARPTPEDRATFEMADFHLIHNEHHEANWPKAMSCWNTVINIDPQNIPARREMMRYFYEMADSGSWQAWKNVHDNASELIKISREKGVDVDTELLLGARAGRFGHRSAAEPPSVGNS